jgi:hypothetical protein
MEKRVPNKIKLAGRQTKIVFQTGPIFMEGGLQEIRN